MKKNFFPVALMALAIGFNACSSDDVTVNANGGALDGNVAVLEGGYVKMAINMPSEPSSRASNSNNDNFEDGLPKEFEVKNATLLLFAGNDNESEDQAVFHSAYKLDVSMAKEGAQITSTTRIVQPVNDEVYAKKANLYAYVLLNNNGLVTFDGTSSTTPTLNHLKVKSGTAVPSMSESTTFKTFREYIVDGGENTFSTDGFLMNNAPLSNVAGGVDAGRKVRTLIKLDKVYRTKAAADEADAKEVFVERALAKVTMSSKSGALTASDAVIVTTPNIGTATPGSPEAKTAAEADLATYKNYTTEGWILDVTNPESFLGRNYNEAWSLYNNDSKYRFVGTTPLRKDVAAHEGSAFYRTYWGLDPNYTKSDGGTFNHIAKDGSGIEDNKFGANNPLYCMENTFDVERMAEGSQVTRAIVKVKFFNGKTFYTFNGDNTTLYDEEKMKARVEQTIRDNGYFVNEFSGYTINSITLNFKERDENGVKNLDNIVVNRTKGTTTDNATYDKTKCGKELNELLMLGNIHQYVNGLAYYSIPIKHFGKDLTPWDNTTATVGKPYGDPINEASEKSYLGRYGVLRNNWYDISISAIRNVGSPVVPETVTPDEVKNYIAVRINVLSWAKRTQEEEL